MLTKISQGKNPDNQCYPLWPLQVEHGWSLFILVWLLFRLRSVLLILVGAWANFFLLTAWLESPPARHTFYLNHCRCRLDLHLEHIRASTVCGASMYHPNNTYMIGNSPGLYITYVFYLGKPSCVILGSVYFRIANGDCMIGIVCVCTITCVCMCIYIICVWVCVVVYVCMCEYCRTPSGDCMIGIAPWHQLLMLWASKVFHATKPLLRCHYVYHCHL